MTAVFSMIHSREVHEIKAASKNGRRFTIDIYKDPHGHHEADVIVFERGPTVPGWVFPVTATTPDANGHFKAALVFIQRYLAKADVSDALSDIHNPCNCPFVSHPDQRHIAQSLGIIVPVRVN
jgi:hypothetical protein